MLYAFGDSFSYGHQLPEDVRASSCWPSALARMIGVDVVNDAVPGSSNWRTARKLQQLQLMPNDIVVIDWTTFDRFEFGVSSTHNTEAKLMGDVVEIQGNVRSKRFFRKLSTRTNDQFTKQFNNLAYSKFFNPYWFAEMHTVMVNACIYKLQKSGCKWVMFDAWHENVNYALTIRDINFPNYISPGTTMCELLSIDEVRYWNVAEHEEVARIVYNKLQELYNTLDT